jgi:hypothetical protein
MQTHSGARIARNLVSPYGLAGISFLIFLFSWLFPPYIYSSVMREKDLLFFSLPTLGFYILCVLAFTIGVWISYPQEIPLSVPKLSARIPPVIFLVLPVLFGLLSVARALQQTFKQTPNLLLLIAAQQASSLKGANTLVTEDQLASAAPVLAGLSWWVIWRFWQLGLKGWRSQIVRFVILVTVLAVVASSVVLVSRNLIMETVAGLGILYVLHREAEGRLSVAFAFRMGSIFFVGIALLFGVFSFIRGTSSLDSQLELLLGYSSASYNRLAALGEGSLHYPFAGHGLYLSSFLSFNKTLHRLIPLDQMFHWPGFFEEWTSEFGAVERSGLNGSMVFLSAFGFIFCDLGWLSPLWLLMYGLFYGVVWRVMRRSSVLGIVLYPFFGFCVLFWFGTNLLLDSALIPILKYGIILFFYEKLLIKVGDQSNTD